MERRLKFSLIFNQPFQKTKSTKGRTYLRPPCPPFLCLQTKSKKIQHQKYPSSTSSPFSTLQSPFRFPCSLPNIKIHNLHTYFHPASLSLLPSPVSRLPSPLPLLLSHLTHITYHIIIKLSISSLSLFQYITPSIHYPSPSSFI